jgi:hypothetical protein
MAIFSPFIEFYAERPELARHFARELFFRRSEETHGMAALNIRLVGLIAGVLQRGVDSGRLRQDLCLAEAVSLVPAQYGFWVQSWLGVESIPEAEVAPGLRRGLRLSIEGMGAGVETRSKRTHDTEISGKARKVRRPQR